MTDKVRDELLALIQKAKDICANDYSEHTENEYIADMILDTGMVNEWIPVTERLPEADINVLAITASGHFKVAGCNFYETEVYWRTNDGLGNNSITHWMPLPDAPKDGDT